MLTIAAIGIRGLPGVQGGVEMHCENIYTRMRDAHIRVYRRKPYLSELSRTEFPNISYVDLPSTRIKGFEAVLHTFLCVLHIAVHRPDVVHVHNIGPGMFAPLLKLLGLSVVMTYHSPNYEHKKWGAVARAILRFSEFLSLNFVDRVIFVNKFQMQKYSRRIQAKSEYIPNGINDVSPSGRTDFLQKYGIVPGEYVLAVGRLTPEKGFEYLVKAAAELPDVKQVVIAGASDHDTSYQELLHRLDTAKKVVFTGFTSGEDLRQLYSHARLYALTSVNEGFPLVLLEAMSYSLPLVASDIPATHLIELDKNDYFKVADEGDLKRVLAEKMRQNLGRVKYEAIKDFDWQKIADETMRAISACSR